MQKPLTVELYRNMNLPVPCLSKKQLGRSIAKRRNHLSFWATVCKTVRPMLSDSVCNVGVLWPNGWMNQDDTCYTTEIGRGPRSHCVTWGPSSPTKERGTAATIPTFRPKLFWHGRPSQQLLSLCHITVGKKVKASHTRQRALGPELITVYRQSACR